jgi:hypothetical protein
MARIHGTGAIPAEPALGAVTPPATFAPGIAA